MMTSLSVTVLAQRASVSVTLIRQDTPQDGPLLAVGGFVCDQLPAEVVINPEADVFIGVLLNMREPGVDGQGCGSVSLTGQ